MSKILGLLALVVVVLGGLYFFSDVFSTKADNMFRQFSEWTPENIAKDPVNYLNFLEEKAKTGLDDLKAKQISVSQQSARLEGMIEERRKKVQLGEQELGKLKDLYRAAEAAGSDSLSYAGSELNLDAAKRQILKFFKEVESNKKQLGPIQSAMTQLEAAKQQLASKKDAFETQLTEIASKREMIKVKELSDDVKKQLVDLKGLVSSSLAGVDVDMGGSKSLDDLLAASEVSVDDDKFAEIMGK